MNTQIKLSIVTPSFNQDAYIEETILSVLNQNYSNFEYFIMDGGSKDNSVKIIQKYADRMTGWVSEQDRGQSHAINKGFKRCSGDIYGWLNSDDIYLPGTLEFASVFFQNHPEVGLIYGDAEIVDSQGRFIKHRKELPFDRTMGILIGWGTIISQPTVFFRKEVVEKIGYLNEEFNYALDAEYWMRVSRYFKIVHIPKLLAKARYHSKMKTMQMEKQNKRYQKEIDFIQKESYNNLFISRWVPFSFVPLISRVYRLKRFFLRFVYGHYFQGYKAENQVRKLIKLQ